MKVTGYKLKEAIKIKQIELSAIESQFNDTLFVFAGEEGKSLKPEEAAKRISELEKDISLLQTAQSYYNLQVQVPHGESQIYLENAIKLLGGLGRTTKRWKDAAQGHNDKRSYYTRPTSVRSKDEIVAQPTVTKLEAIENAKDSEKVALSLRSAISIANGKEIEIDFINGTLS